MNRTISTSEKNRYEGGQRRKMHVSKMATTLNKEGTSHADQGIQKLNEQYDFGCSDTHSRRGADPHSVEPSDSTADEGFEHLKELYDWPHSATHSSGTTHYCSRACKVEVAGSDGESIEEGGTANETPVRTSTRAYLFRKRPAAIMDTISEVNSAESIDIDSD
ncbi:hypothetical protein PRIPAC_70909 [Pristionchus pacificus]|uniref:Uncharacterized protein n=1 Tax=Pristionchus pacificus TaxID=54126 RepID=A0A2A6BF05_PRIPA|nr:hypothetical protein PRIPAC_70909 [Pristionchus pacificus]|eukprot:PDM64443.1 hypothetical protein PRIPAC_52699 [Pristionchus pacificus]